MNDDATDERAANRNTDRRSLLHGAAAAGLASGGFGALADTATGQSGEHELVVRAASGERVRYTIRVSGTIEPGDEADYSDAVLNGTVAKGQTADGKADSFTFTGELRKVRLNGPGKVFVDGELVEDTTETLPNRIAITGKAKSVQYAFSVTGRVEKAETADDEDQIRDSEVEGVVGKGATDDYYYSGTISFEQTENPATVTLELASKE